MEDKKIIEAEFVTNSGYCTVIVKFEDMLTATAFSYFVDELNFKETELVGLTLKEARELHFKKDKEYLQS